MNYGAGTIRFSRMATRFSVPFGLPDPSGSVRGRPSSMRDVGRRASYDVTTCVRCSRPVRPPPSSTPARWIADVDIPTAVVVTTRTERSRWMHSDGWPSRSGRQRVRVRRRPHGVRPRWTSRPSSSPRAVRSRGAGREQRQRADEHRAASRRGQRRSSSRSGSWRASSTTSRSRMAPRTSSRNRRRASWSADGPTRPRLTASLQGVREQRLRQRLRAVDPLLQLVLPAERQAVGEELAARRARRPRGARASRPPRRRPRGTTAGRCAR